MSVLINPLQLFLKWSGMPSVKASCTSVSCRKRQASLSCQDKHFQGGNSWLDSYLSASVHTRSLDQGNLRRILGDWHHENNSSYFLRMKKNTHTKKQIILLVFGRKTPTTTNLFSFGVEIAEAQKSWLLGPMPNLWVPTILLQDTWR